MTGCHVSTLPGQLRVHTSVHTRAHTRTLSDGLTRSQPSGCTDLRNVRLVHLEHLAAAPQAVLDGICADLGIATYPLADGKVVAEVNRKYAAEWKRESEHIKSRLLAHAPAFRQFGYTMDNLNAADEAADCAPPRPGQSSPDPKQVPGQPSPDPKHVHKVNAVEANSVVAAQGGGGVKRPAGSSEAGSDSGDTSTDAPTDELEINVAKVARVLAPPALSGGGARRPLILTFGTRGDVQPFIPLALEMQARGMQPLLLSLPLFRPLIEGSGVGFASLVGNGSVASNPPPWPPAFTPPRPTPPRIGPCAASPHPASPHPASHRLVSSRLARTLTRTHALELLSTQRRSQPPRPTSTTRVRTSSCTASPTFTRRTAMRWCAACASMSRRTRPMCL